MKKIVIGILVIGILGAGAIFFMNSRDTSSVIAIVNGEKITNTEFEDIKNRIIKQNGIDFSTWDEETKKQFETSMLDALINQKVLEQSVADANITIEDFEVEAKFIEIKAQIGDEEEYNSFLANENFTEQTFKEQIKKGMKQEKYFEQKIDFSTITITDEEIQAAFEQVSQGQDIGTLEKNKEDLRNYVFGQKRQELIVDFVNSLQESAEIEKLIQI